MESGLSIQIIKLESKYRESIKTANPCKIKDFLHTKVMIKLKVRVANGRSRSRLYIPSNGGGENFSNGVGTKVADNVKEALGKKGKPIEMGKAYKDANPQYDPTQTYDEYTANCQRCVVAYEMRRRGYDVTAQPTYYGDKLPQVKMVGNTKWGRWQGAFKNAKPMNVGGKKSADVVKNIQAKMKEFGDGSRGVVSITYKGKNFGHVFNVEQRKGTTYFVDAQTGERVRAQKFFEITDRSTITLTRTDNLKISDRTKNFVTNESAYKRKKKK